MTARVRTSVRDRQTSKGIRSRRLRSMTAILVGVLTVSNLVAGCNLTLSTEKPSASATPATEQDVTELGKISVNLTGRLPEIKAAWPLNFTGSVAKVVKAGTGAVIASGDTVTYDFMSVNPTNGVTLSNDFENSATTGVPGQSTMNLESSQVEAGLSKTLVGAKVGTYVLAVAADPDSKEKVLGLFRINSAAKPGDVKKDATDQQQAPARVAESALPKIIQDANKPTMVKPTGAAPLTSQYAVLREGSGSPVESGKDIVVTFAGFSWATGEMFDSTYVRKIPLRYLLGSGQALVPCLDKVLPGRNVGSVVEVVCSAADSYGANPSAGYPAGALVYLVEILPSES